MPKIFEYFGFVFFFYSNEHEPIHVHVTHKGCQSIFELIMDNGILTEIRVREKAGEEPRKPALAGTFSPERASIRITEGHGSGSTVGPQQGYQGCTVIL